jgi:hypothetical protein
MKPVDSQFAKACLSVLFGVAEFGTYENIKVPCKLA